MTTRLLTNLDDRFSVYLVEEAKRKKITKRHVLERAIATYMQVEEKNAIETAYQNMSKDTEYLREMEENTKYLWCL